MTIRVTIDDPLIPDHTGSTLVSIREGRLQVIEGATWDAELALNIASFSSLWMGATDLYSLLRVGKAHVSRSQSVAALQQLLLTDARPQFTQRI